MIRQTNPERSARSVNLRVVIPQAAIGKGLPWSVERLHEANSADIVYGKLDHYLLCWSSCGRGKMRLRMSDRDLPKMRLYLLRPGTVHTFLAYPRDGWLIRFRPAFVGKSVVEKLRLHFLASRPYVDLDADQLQRLEQVAAQMERCNDEAAEPDLVRAYITLLTELAATFYRQANGVMTVHPHERLLLQLLDLIDSHFREQQTTAFYARKLGVVPRKLNEVSLMGTGFLVPELIEDRRLGEAEVLLATTKLLHKEIAHQLGFISSSHLNFWFRRRRGMHPRAYRELALTDTSYR